MQHVLRLRLRLRRALDARFDKGATAVEYALMVGLIALVIIAAVTLLGVNLRGFFNERVQQHLTNALLAHAKALSGVRCAVYYSLNFGSADDGGPYLPRKGSAVAARGPRRERGAAAVEFALLLPVLFLIIGATIDFGRFFYIQNVTVNAAREGARMMALGYPIGTAATDPSAKRRVSQAMISVPTYTDTYRFIPASGSPVVNGACPTSSALPGDHVDVTVTVDTFSFMVLGPAFNIMGGTIAQPKPSGTADVRCGG